MPHDGSRRAGGSPPAAAGPAALILTGIVSVQLGAGLAIRLFTELSPATVTGLRLWSATAALLVVGTRGRSGLAAAAAGLVRRRAWRDAATAISFGICLGVMNFVFYQAIARIPLGVAVTIEFLGPLAVAVAGSRRLLDLLWVALAATGVVLLTGGGAGHLDVAGVAFAALSAAGWAGYIMCSSATGRRFPGSSGLVIAMLVASALVTPTAVAAASSALARPSVIATGAGVGLLSSAIPYGLELQALRRLSKRVFGIWMSLEPVAAALIGLALLGQRLSPAEWAAVACVVIACVGAARGTPPSGPTYDGPAYHGDVPADLAPAAPSGVLPGSRTRQLLSRITAPVLSPTPGSMRNLALASVASNAVLIATGEAVRLSQSGLGCPDWPTCTRGSLVAAHSAGQTLLNTWIEFGNRLLTYPLVAIAGLMLIAAWQYRPPGSDRRRRDLLWLAAALPAGVICQAVVGGIVVLTKLNPGWVAAHFMLSTAILGAAVILHARCGEGTGPATPVVRRDLRLIAAALVAVVAVMFAAGTVVTGTGPLAGNAAAPRFQLPFLGVTQFHADIGWLIGGLTFALILGLRLSGAPRRAMMRGWALGALVLAQGAIGYAQYFSGLPAGLVWVHVVVAVAIWITVLQLFLALRDRGPAEAVTPGGPLSGQAGTEGPGRTAQDRATAPAPGG
jgi:threonine/homoserine efflux transporter RhtA/heme A synthase